MMDNHEDGKVKNWIIGLKLTLAGILALGTYWLLPDFDELATIGDAVHIVSVGFIIYNLTRIPEWRE